MADVSQWYWEVWNEPDYAGFWTGTIADYYTLYDNAVDGITAVIPNANVGGPATTEPSKIAAFLQHCKTANKRVTFVSSHVYPGGAAAGAAANATGLLNDNNTRREPDHQRRLHDGGGEVVQHRMELVVQRPGRPHRRRRHEHGQPLERRRSSSRASSCSPT